MTFLGEVQKSFLKAIKKVNNFIHPFERCLVNFLDQYHSSKGLSNEWITKVNAHCTNTKVVIKDLSALAFKAKDHAEVASAAAIRLTDQLDCLEESLKTFETLQNSCLQDSAGPAELDLLKQKVKVLEQ